MVPFQPYRFKAKDNLSTFLFYYTIICQITAKNILIYRDMTNN